MKDFIKYINNSNSYHILADIKNLDDFYKFVENAHKVLNIISVSQIDYLLKIIFKKIIDFNGNVDNNNFNKLYLKIQNKDIINIILLNDFIDIFDNLKIIKEKFILLNKIIIKSFRNKIDSISSYHDISDLSNTDLENIKSIIENYIYPYYNSFFEIKYNKYFFKRIIDAKLYKNQQINSIEMLDRLIELCKIFKLDTLIKLNVEVISIRDFEELSYIDKIEYFKKFYSKTNLIFKLYYKFYNKLNSLSEKITALIDIDDLNYNDKFNDSTSSLFMSDDKSLNFNMEYSDLSVSEYNTEDDNDTLDNNATNKKNNILYDDNDTSINDLFINDDNLEIE